MADPLVGLFTETSVRGNRSPRQYLRVLGRSLVLADKLGFDFFGVTQNYGRDSAATSFSISPDPLSFFAAHIPRTRRIKILTAILIGPVHHPGVALSQAALVDNLSDGRVMLGVGRGHPWIYDRLGVPQQESRVRMAEFLNFTRQLLDGPDLRHSIAGDIWTLNDFELWPKFVQPELPVYVAAARSAEGAQDAARLGFGLLMPSYLGMEIERVEQQIAIYREAARRHRGNEGRVLLGVQVYGDADAALAVERGARTFASQMEIFRRDLELFGGQVGQNYPGYQQMGEQFKQLSDPDYVREKFLRDWPTHLSIWGDRDAMLPKFAEIVTRIKPQGLILNVDAGGVPYSHVDSAIRYIGKHLLADLRDLLRDAA